MLPFAATAPMRFSRAPQWNVTSFMQVPVMFRSVRGQALETELWSFYILVEQSEFRFVVSGKPRRSLSPGGLSCFERQSRHRQPPVSVGIGPCGSSAHQQFPFGLQVIGALQRAQRVSTGTIIAQSPRGPVAGNCRLAIVANHYKIERCF